MNLTSELRVKPGKKVNLKHYDPEETFGCKKNHKMQAKLEKDLAQLDQLQYMLYAENKHALLVVLHGFISYKDILRQNYVTEFMGYRNINRFNFEFRDRKVCQGSHNCNV